MKVTKSNYYSKAINNEYMSYSEFKLFDECPAKAMAILNGEYKQEETDSMLVGSYVDAWLDGTIDKFKEEHPEIFTLKGELKAQYKKAEELCEVIKNDKFLLNLLTGKRQVIITGSIAGVKFKGKIDSLLADKIVDGKILKDCEDIWKDGQKQPFYKANGYDWQAIIYKTLYKQQTGKDLPFILAVITKEKSPDKRIFVFKDETLNDALQEIICKAPIYQKIKKGEEPAWNCGKCDYCKSIKALNENSVEEI